MAKETILRSDMSAELRSALGLSEEEYADTPISQHATISVTFADGRMEPWKADVHVEEAKALKTAFPKAVGFARRGRKPKATA